MLEIILKEVKGVEAIEASAAPKALALQTARKKSSDQEAALAAGSAQANRGGGSSVDCKIWPWDMGMGFGPNSGLRVRC